MIKRCFPLLLLFLGMLALSDGARAACKATLSTLAPSFGSASSFLVSSGKFTTSVNLMLKCDLVLLSLFDSDYVSITFSDATNLNGSQATLKVDTTGTDNIPINVCPSSSDCSSSIQKSDKANYPRDILAKLLTSTTFTIPITFQTTPGQNVAAGQYKVKVDLLIAWNICGTLGVGNILCVNQQNSSTTLSPELTLTVTNDCITIDAPNVDFGNAPLVSGLPDVAQSIGITCTKGSVYSVGISDGQNAVNGVRQMISGSNRIAYDIYQDTPAASRWGSSGNQRWSSAASSSLSSDGLTRYYKYLARILSGQSTPAAGTYTDMLVVDITF